VLEKANEYLGTNHSYGETVKHEGMPIMYDDRVEATKRQPVGLAPSTVWRWLSLLGEMRGTLRTATKLIRGKEPDFLVHREACTVPARKYRSHRRRDTLLQAMRLLLVDRVCAKLFGKGIFPRYEMIPGWS